MLRSQGMQPKCKSQVRAKPPPAPARGGLLPGFLLLCVLLSSCNLPLGGLEVNTSDLVPTMVAVFERSLQSGGKALGEFADQLSGALRAIARGGGDLPLSSTGSSLLKQPTTTGDANPTAAVLLLPTAEAQSTPGMPAFTPAIPNPTIAPGSAVPAQTQVFTATLLPTGLPSLTPSATPLSPSSIPPSATAMGPTATPRPPSATPKPPSATPAPSSTPKPPTATPASPTNTPLPPTAAAGCEWSGNTSFESTLVSLINSERSSRGLPTLIVHVNLKAAARAHSEDMGCNGFFSHTGSDGSSPFSRMLAWNYPYVAAGENIYAGSGSFNNPNSAFQGWMNSPGHQAIMLSTEYTEIGIGYRNVPGSPYGGYFTGNFGRR